MTESQSYWAAFTLQTYNCAYAVMIWDTLLTLSEEKRKVWDREWSPAKVIFFFNRYYGLASITMNLCFYNIQVSTEECAKYVKAEPLLGNFAILSYQSILLLRCYAVWLRDKRILFGGIAILVCQFVEAMYAISGFFPLPITTETGPCVVQGQKFWIASVFLFPTLTDTILTVVTFARVLYIVPKTRSSVISRFLKEGFLFFLIVFVGNCANGILYLQANKDISTIFSGFAIISGNVCGNHLLLGARHDGSAASTSDFAPGTGPGHDRGVWPGSGVLVHTTVDVALSDLPTNKRLEDLERTESLRK
ncbi:uncharacterized protein EV420DRAFT_1528940 [Desarmillaria tabescens]|uniref:DUF6533 domain-containing protein n=1 Tax=Armillaria tabescens TaxID=1929756 RepID=A0AA39NAL3_ARMTA|nr:uncharacterized protein EV420DRAFT_1528940 [Desarmillaria tabescens]KAK0462097.1 hypothetical protein EV420DRAFT_1528940 [Desarmillaria tabescens]